MKKTLFTVLTVILSAIFCTAILAGCGGGSNEPGGIIDGEVDTGKSITLYIESAAPLKYNYNALLKSEPEGSQTYNQALFTKTLIDGFKELYPNITLRFIEDGWGDALWQQQQLYIRSYQQGTKPQVDILIGEIYMGYLSENGVFAELNAEKFAHVLEGPYGDMYVNGKTYGVPMCTGLMGLQYNADILEEAGIPEEDWEPETWDDLLENCKKVYEYAAANNKSYGGIVMNNVKGLSSAYRALPFMRAAGGDFTDGNGAFALDSAANVKAFTYLRSLAQYAYADSLSETNEDTLQYLFNNQSRGAYFIDGQWAMIGAGENIRSCKLPSDNEGGVGNCYVGNVLFGIANWSDNKAAAQAFLEYLTSAEIQEALYKLDGRLPVNKEYLEGEAIKEVQPNMNSYIDAMLAGGFSGGVPSVTQNSNSIWEKWGNFYSSVLVSKDDISSLAKAANDSINADLE